MHFPIDAGQIKVRSLGADFKDRRNIIRCGRVFGIQRVAYVHIRTLITHEVKELVFLDGSANGSPELIVDVFGLGQGAVSAPLIRLEGAIGVELKQRAMDRVVASLVTDTAAPTTAAWFESVT